MREAIPRYLEVLRVKPGDPDAHYQLALCYIDLGQVADARTQLQTIAPNNPHFTDAQKRLSMLDATPAGQAPVQAQALDNNAAPANSMRTTDDGGAQMASQPANPVTNVQPPVQSPTQQQSQPPIEQPLESSNPTAQQPMQSQPGQPNPQLAFQPPTQTAQPAAVSQQPTTPVPVLANTQVRVIANGFNAPAGSAFDRQGNLYVANFLSNTVDRIFADGSRERFCTGTNLKGPIGLVVDATNNLYVANYLGGTVARISPSGSLGRHRLRLQATLLLNHRQRRQPLRQPASGQLHRPHSTAQGSNRGTAVTTGMAEFRPHVYTPLRKFCHMFTARFLLRPIYHLRNQVEIYGRENIPPNTKFLIVGNHLSQWDPPLLCIGTDIPMAYVAKTELFEIRLLKPLIEFYGAIPINRNKPEKSAIKTIKKVFENGWNVGMFIEGTRSKKPGYLGPPHTGAAYFAYTNKVPILPVGLVGTNKNWSKAKVVIGKPIEPTKDYERTTWEVMEALSQLTGFKLPTEHALAQMID